MIRKYLDHPLGYAISAGIGLMLGGLYGGPTPIAALGLVVGLMLVLIGSVALMGEE